MKRYWLEDLRNKDNLTHQDIANKVEISRQYYGMIENGKRDPSVKTAKKIASIFNINWIIFFNHSGYTL